MTRITLAVVLVAAITTTGTRAGAIGTAIAEYDPWTRRIVISAVGINNWYIDSASSRFTGDEPNLPGDGIAINNDGQIGETDLALLPALVNWELGAVVGSKLPEGDLTLWYNSGVGRVLRQGYVIRFIPEPASVCLLAMGLCGVLAVRRRMDNRLH